MKANDSGQRITRIQCPVCQSKLRSVVDCRSPKSERSGPFIRRRIKCGNGHSYTTYERPAWLWDRDDGPRKAVKRIKELVEKL